MSDSFRKTYIIKSSRDGSNKKWKVSVHRLFRRKEKAMWATEAAIYPSKMREVSEIWCSHQEYNHYFGGYIESQWLLDRPYKWFMK